MEKFYQLCGYLHLEVAKLESRTIDSEISPMSAHCTHHRLGLGEGCRAGQARHAIRSEHKVSMKWK